MEISAESETVGLTSIGGVHSLVPLSHKNWPLRGTAEGRHGQEVL